MTTDTKKQRRSIRAIYRGEYSRISFDPASVARLKWAEHALTQLGAEARVSTVVRLALAEYVKHLDKLLDKPRDDPKVLFTVYGAAHANAGKDLGIPVSVFTTGELRPFQRIVDEWRKAQPTPMDLLRRGVDS